jgi:hypothetical protein
MVKTRKTPDQASPVDGDEPVMANPGFVVPDNADIGNVESHNSDRFDSRAKNPDDGVEDDDPVEHETESDDGSETDSDSDGEKQTVADLVRQAQHEHATTLGRMMKTMSKNQKELKDVIFEATDITPKAQTDRLIMIKILGNQEELKTEQTSLHESAMREMRENQNKLLSEITAMQDRQMAQINENQTRLLETLMAKNTTKIAEALGIVMSNMSNDLIRELKPNNAPQQVPCNPDVAGESSQTPPNPGAKVTKTRPTPSPRLRRSLPKSVVHLESDSDSNDCDHSSSRHSTSSRCTTATVSSRDSTSGPNKRLKLPSFTGTKENWEIWFNRFSDVTERFGLSESQKLDELLPRLEGQAGDFVFGQLTLSIRSNYRKLIAELSSRFKKIESCKTYGQKFARRHQQSDETPEAFSAELKRLYDKAYPGRATEVRDEDLLRRFFDGLSDSKTKLQIEFFKTPDTLDEAVALVVNFEETRQRCKGKSVTGNQKQHSRVDGDVVVVSDSENETPDPNTTTARVTRTNPNAQNKKTSSDDKSGHDNSSVSMNETQIMEILKKFTAETIASTAETITAEIEKATKCQNPRFGQSRQNKAPYAQENSHGQARPPRSSNNNNSTMPTLPNQRTCWTCGIVGHIAQF